MLRKGTDSLPNILLYISRRRRPHKRKVRTDCHVTQRRLVSNEARCQNMEHFDRDYVMKEEHQEDTCIIKEFNEVIKNSSKISHIKKTAGVQKVLKYDSKSSVLKSPSNNKQDRAFFEERFQNYTIVFCNYIQACLHSGLITRALNLLDDRIKSLDRPGMQPSKAAFEPQVYDIILNRLAAISPTATINCNLMQNTKESHPLDIIRQLFNVMQRLNVKPSPSAYAAALEAMDKTLGQKMMISLCLRQIKEDGYTLDEIIRSSIPGSKSAKNVRNAIKQVTEMEDFSTASHQSNYDVEDEDIPVLVEDIYKNECSPSALHLSSSMNFHTNYNEQIELEKNRLLEVDNILDYGNESTDRAMKKRLLNDLLNEWRKSLLLNFRSLKMRERLKHTLPGKNDDNMPGAGAKAYPFLCLLPDEEYIEIIINHLCSTINGGDFTALTSHKLGKEVYHRFLLRRIKDSGIYPRLQTVYKKYTSLYTNPQEQLSTFIPRKLWMELENKYGLTNLEEKVLPWNRYWVLTVGMKLIEVMNTVTFIPQKYWRTGILHSNVERVPAIFNSYVVRGRKQFGMTIPHPQFRVLLREGLDKLIFESEVAPMVVPPRPWCGISHGGLLVNQVEFVRSGAVDEESEENIKQSSGLEDKKLAPVFDALNVLGSVAWILNKPLLDLQIKYFRNNGSKELSIPQPSSQSEAIPDLSLISPNETAKYTKAREKAIEVRKQRCEMHSLFMEALYKLSIANMYRDNIIWFVHNIDFRGRFYPVARHLNYMGSDLYRSLFLFAEGRQLGENGLDWLKIHCINLTEFKKQDCIEDRLSYANEVIHKIFDSADNPEKPDAWWKTSDKPWQTLAACIEITAACRSPDHTKYISRLPVHQDGSCNGLQHYAALGRDVLGAKQVNLSPSIVPQDVYTGVADKAEELRKIDAENGHAIANSLEGYVRRKIVKQTVMTTVYGVTRYGGTQQIKKQLAYLEDEFPRSESFRGANYLVDKVLNSIDEMFSGARSIQAWLTQIADVVSKLGYPVDWITPLNMNVVQPYYKQTSKFILSPVQRLQVNENVLSLPCSRKQRNGFPPNFIHSLDSTHMMLTALYCYREGVTFASVHDCFWTHASSIETMSKICRKQFIALHSQPILHHLANHLRKHLPQNTEESTTTPLEAKLLDLLDNVPQQGHFDLNDVQDSTFFFS
ncbi:DNA-directed RNA polymerase, mitochondrial-like isoform X1 [Styela clava]